MVSVNNSTSGAEAHLPFGGNGKSGNGSRQSGIWVLDQFTRWQSMNWDYAGKLQKAQMDLVELRATWSSASLARRGARRDRSVRGGAPRRAGTLARGGHAGTGGRHAVPAGTRFGGGTSSATCWAAGRAGRRRRPGRWRRVGDVAGERLAELVVEAVDGLGADAEGARRARRSRACGGRRRRSRRRPAPGRSAASRSRRRRRSPRSAGSAPGPSWRARRRRTGSRRRRRSRRPGRVPASAAPSAAGKA